MGNIAGNGRALLLASFVAFCSWAPSAPAADDDKTADPEFSRRGADQCLNCHDEPRIATIFRTPHGQRADAASPMAGLQCESCHGPGGTHSARLRKDEVRPPITNFERDSPTPVAEENAICAGCHGKEVGRGWQGSEHEAQDVACASCHTIHAPADPALGRTSQAEVCFTCHATERAQTLKASSHPLRENKMACTGCHNPHESVTDHLLARENVNQTCYSCHADKRGPFLWEHAPVSEDCTLCHDAHGSNHPALLNRPAPLLCQQCHSQAGHPSLVYTPTGLPGGSSPSAYVLGGSCTNCHSKVHGSNHPSGGRLMR